MLDVGQSWVKVRNLELDSGLTFFFSLYLPFAFDLAACLYIIHNKVHLPKFLTSTKSKAESF